MTGIDPGILALPLAPALAPAPTPLGLEGRGQSPGPAELVVVVTAESEANKGPGGGAGGTATTPKSGRSRGGWEIVKEEEAGWMAPGEACAMEREAVAPATCRKTYKKN